MPRKGNYTEVIISGTKYLVPQGLVNLLVKQALPAGVPAEHSKLYKSLLATTGDPQEAMKLLQQAIAKRKDK